MTPYVCFIDDNPIGFMAKDRPKNERCHPLDNDSVNLMANLIKLFGMKSLFGKQQDNGGQDRVGCLEKIILRNI